jgi:DNA-binding XRE family transcriptional regulator
MENRNMVRTYRNYRNWTQQDFAAWSELSIKTVWTYEQDPDNIPIAMTRLLALLMALEGVGANVGTTKAERRAMSEAIHIIESYKRRTIAPK